MCVCKCSSAAVKLCFFRTTRSDKNNKLSFRWSSSYRDNIAELATASREYSRSSALKHLVSEDTAEEEPGISHKWREVLGALLVWNNDSVQTCLCVEASPGLTQKVFFNLVSPAKLKCTLLCLYLWSVELLPQRKHSWKRRFFHFFLLSQLKQLKSVPKGSDRKPIPGSFLPFCIFYNWKMEMRVITMLCLCSGSQAKVKYLSYNIKKGSLVQPECSLCLQPGDESCLRQPWNLFDTLQESPNKG